MNKRLYIGNLSYDTTEEGLRTAFDAVGEVVDAVVVSDRYSGRSRGFGFVEMATEEGAQKAIEQLNDSQLDGRNIRVAEANPRTNRDNRRDSFNSGGSSDRW